ncbi:protein-glutamate O-methyltransferase CheR [Pseudoduganella sp. LjRoot289]
MSEAALSEQEFAQFQRFIYEAAGIHLSPAKRALVGGRLARRLGPCKARSYGEYFKLLSSGGAPDEVQTAVDLLTTNETYFFREQKHFDFLRGLALEAARAGLPMRVWSAASSSGEEAYSIAMLLADCMPARPWEVFGSDISLRVLQRARRGHYPMERASHIPPAYLQRYCLKGTGQQQGTLLVAPALRSRVQFSQVNLNEALADLGQFDVIFLRNVMIYFDGDTKRAVVARVLAQLRPGGHFCIGHSESLNGISDAVEQVAPAIYRKR